MNIPFEIDFVVDTGAHRTHLNPSGDTRDLIPFDLLQDRIESVGIGGVTSNFRELAYLAFEDGNLTRVYMVELLIAEPRTGIESGVPSLLGRDLLYHWEMMYSPMRGRLESEVLSTHLTAQT